MSKTNFSKVEEALAEGMRKMAVNKLLDIADEVKAVNSPATNTAPPKKGPSELETQLLTALRIELKTMVKQGEEPYVTLGINQQELKKFIDHPEALTLQDWENIKKMKEKVDLFRKELDKIPHASDDDLVNAQRNKHVTKRFNVNDNWIPLQ